MKNIKVKCTIYKNTQKIILHFENRDSHVHKNYRKTVKHIEVENFNFTKKNKIEILSIDKKEISCDGKKDKVPEVASK
jgi:hypothetical protein